MKRLVTLLAAVVALASCTIEPPLHVRKTHDFMLDLETKADVDLMWQLNWKGIWDFRWNEELWGPLGYSEPKGIKMHVYSLDDAYNPVGYYVHNFDGTSGTVPIMVGTHNFLFHNNRTEYIIYRSDNELSPITATTGIVSKGLRSATMVQTSAQKSSMQKTEYSMQQEQVANAPDELFTMYTEKFKVTDDPADYQFVNGRYVAYIDGCLMPATYIYLLQVRLFNNDDRIVGSDGGAAITGMADAVQMQTRISSDTPVANMFELHFDKAMPGEDRVDMLAGRVVTFGMVGIDPYKGVPAGYDIPNYVVMNITYLNGWHRNIKVDITDQVRDLPLGGVITLDLDVNDFPIEAGGGDGGFEAVIDGWDEYHGEIEID